MFKFLTKCLVAFIPTLAHSHETSIMLKDLHTHPLAGDVFNIEGAKPTQFLTSQQIWSNIAIVLDQPLVNGVTLEELTAKNDKFPLKETTIPIYNEAQVNLAYLLICAHYIENAHNISHIPQENDVNITFHIHRNSSAPAHIHLLQSLLHKAYPQEYVISQDETSPFKSLYFPEKNVSVHFKKGYMLEDFKSYEKSNIVVSVSLVGGLNPDLPSGSIVIPEKFIPMDIKTHQVFAYQSYSVSNHMAGISPLLVTHPKHDLWVALMNEDFLSPSKAKSHLKAQRMKEDDFKKVRLLEIEANFNPKDGTQLVTIYTS